MKYLLVCLFMYTIILPVYSASKGTAMGGVETVISGGYADVSRNPALVPQCKGSGSWGIMTGYQQQVTENSSTDFDITDLTDSETELESKSAIYAGLSVGFLKKIGKSGIGINFISGESALYSKSETELDITGTATDPGPPVNTFNIDRSQTEEETTISPAVSLAWGYKTSATNSIGLNIKVSYQQKEKVQDVDTFFSSSTGSAETKQKAETVNKKVSLNLNLGYLDLNSTKNMQVGLILGAGQLTWESISLDNKLEDFSIPSTDTDSKTTPYKFKYDKGPSILVGCYYRFLKKFAFVVELGNQFPIEYKETNLEYSEDSGEIEETESDTTFSYLFLVKAGIEANITDSFTILAGGNFSSSMLDSSEVEDDTVKGEFNIKSMSASVGFEYKINENTLIYFITGYAYSDLKLMNEEISQSSIKFNTKQHLVGASLSFTRYF